MSIIIKVTKYSNCIRFTVYLKSYAVSERSTFYPFCPLMQSLDEQKLDSMTSSNSTIRIFYFAFSVRRRVEYMHIVHEISKDDAISAEEMCSICWEAGAIVAAKIFGICNEDHAVFAVKIIQYLL